MSPSRRIALAVALCAALAVISLGAAAAAGKKRHRIKFVAVSITLTIAESPTGPDTFTGTISSPNPACIGGLRVEIVNLTGGSPRGPTPVGSTTSAPNGGFVLSAESVSGGSYRASTQPRHLVKRRWCGVGSSNVVPGAN